MSQEKRKYDSTVARIAGNIASGLVKNIPDPDYSPLSFAEKIAIVSKASVCLARAIVAEVERTESSESLAEVAHVHRTARPDGH